MSTACLALAACLIRAKQPSVPITGLLHLSIKARIWQYIWANFWPPPLQSSIQNKCQHQLPPQWQYASSSLLNLYYCNYSRIIIPIIQGQLIVIYAFIPTPRKYQPSTSWLWNCILWFRQNYAKVPEATKRTYHHSRRIDLCFWFWCPDPHTHRRMALQRFESQTSALQTNHQLAWQNIKLVIIYY